MEIYVACATSAAIGTFLPSDREGRKSKCKSCGVPFEIGEENFYDPETSELDEEDDSEDEGSSTSPMRDLAVKIGHGMAGLFTLSILIWMGSLLFRSPDEVAAQSHSQSTSRQSNSPQFQPMPQPSFVPPTPNVQPHGTPRQRPGPGNSRAVPSRPVPPTSGGSIGWPSGDPDPPGSKD